MGEVAKRPISAQCKAELSGGWTCSLRIGQIGGSTSKTTIITVIRIIIIIFNTYAKPACKQRSLKIFTIELVEVNFWKAKLT